MLETKQIKLRVLKCLFVLLRVVLNFFIWFLLFIWWLLDFRMLLLIFSGSFNGTSYKPLKATHCWRSLDKDLSTSCTIRCFSCPVISVWQTQKQRERGHCFKCIILFWSSSWLIIYIWRGSGCSYSACNNFWLLAFESSLY